MLLNRTLSTLLFILCAFQVFSQEKKEVIITTKGKIFTFAERDSLLLDGHQFADKEIRETKDTIYHVVWYYDKSIFLPPYIRDIIDKPIKPFELKSIQDGMINSEKLLGKVTFIHIWQEHPARFEKISGFTNEMNEYNQLVDKYKDRVNFISFTPDSLDNVLRQIKFVTYKFPIITDAHGYLNEIGIQQFPVFLFIDRKGIVRQVKQGIPIKPKQNGHIYDESEPEYVDILNSYSQIIDRLLRY